MNSRYVLGPLLLLLALASAWFLQRLEQTSEPAGSDSNEPDLVMEGFRTVTLDEAGQPLRVLSARKLRHFAAEDTNEIDEPHLTWYRPAGPPVQMQAESAWVGPGQQEALLRGSVHLWEDTPAGTQGLELRTRNLRVHPETQYAETAEAVLIRSAGGETRAMGLQADLAGRSLTLLSEVRSRYESSTHP